MKLGLIGKPLGHSWSPEIHRNIIGADYKLHELEAQDVEDFLRKRDFDGINVTIPYKGAVIRYLDSIDPAAERMQAVNCIVNEGGKLKGYNTDILGLGYMLERHGIDPEDGCAAVLGTGGAGRMAAYVCEQRGWEHCIVSRKSSEGVITYDELYERADEVSLIINATPVGMFPDVDKVPVDIARFPGLGYVVDIVANPVRTSLVMDAADRGLVTSGGLEMLVAQAFAADELFTGKTLDPDLIDKCLNKLRREMLNIVLIGMPSSGKSTLASILGEKSGRKVYDTDDEVIREIGMPIADYFREEGEEAFRDKESAVIRRLSTETGVIISTGGGVIKREENMRNLSHNGIVIWIDRELDGLEATASRPLSSSREALAALYAERKPLYERYSDKHIRNNANPQDAVRKILRILEEI